MAYNVAAMAVLNVRNWDHLEKVQDSLRKKDEASEEQAQNPDEKVQKAQDSFQIIQKSRRSNWVHGGQILSGKWMNQGK